ncbi:MAG: prolipoprotein diacylglyceryl transferase [Acetatifactor sp.]|nr:prolipoprotein diacylglyceryl transferase [Acetatifactor sp.]
MKAWMVSLYSYLFLTSLVVSLTIVCVLLHRRRVPEKIIFYSVFLNSVCILCGAKLYTMLASGLQVDFWRAGPSSLGGAVGLLLGILLFGRIYDREASLFWEVYIMVLPLMYGISKLGCFFAGCCHGIPYDGPLAVSYDNQVLQGGPFFPVQLAESICFLFIFLIGIYLHHRRNRLVCPAVILLCATAKFSLEYLRQEHAGVVLSVNQAVCLCFFCWAVWKSGLSFRSKKEGK